MLDPITIFSERITFIQEFELLRGYTYMHPHIHAAFNNFSLIFSICSDLTVSRSMEHDGGCNREDNITGIS
jgi:hypothetical protein